MRLKGGTAPRYFDCWLQTLAEEGRITSVSGWARDVTAQYESEIRFNELFESLREGVFFATLDGQVIDANPAMLQLLGYSTKEELQAHNLRELYLNPDDRQARVRELELKGSFRDHEVKLLRKDGKTIFCTGLWLLPFEIPSDASTGCKARSWTSPSAARWRKSSTRSRNSCAA